MRGATLVRVAAVTMAVAAVADPAWTAARNHPVPVRVMASTPRPADQALSAEVRDRLAATLGRRIDLNSSLEADAVVVAGAAPTGTDLPDGVPLSFVSLAGDDSRNVRITSLSAPDALEGWTTTISASVEANRAQGETSVIVLEHAGVELGRVEQRWTGGRQIIEARFSFVPPAAGVLALRVTARPLSGEATTADNHADLRLMVERRALHVLVHEPRPSWATSFVRRALESDPLFEVAGFVRPSRGIEVRAGQAPDGLVAGSLDRFDAVVVGAPEDLSGADLDALERFARVRGGTFFLVPDRRPTGAYLRLVPAATFEERLLETPVAAVGGPAPIFASELAVPVRPAPVADAIAVVEQPKGPVPVVMSWPVGLGRGVFVGALDAWRHRAREDGFARFWRAEVAAAAAAAPRRIEAHVHPGVAAPGQTVVLRVRVRPTELEVLPQSVRFPRLAARVVHPGGFVEPVRLWPAFEAGLLEGRFQASKPGRYGVQASAGPDLLVDTAVLVTADANPAATPASATVQALSSASGGVAVAAGDLSALEAHLAALPAASTVVTVYPARSGWWMLTFIALLCAEWGLRRRGGLR